ncbi:secretin and TonB N-terminal domain-containing protein [Chitinivorax sp. B]|uniref:secretin and TonB N-terminal domain-containing protein n=1 Tax=Chitinivorax sp. B TaxID=2502235 RepID=UPI0010F98A73|nr:secretin and TonB N-terminal domain-containing protein [Chitinivorax sp. B]
MTSHPKAVLLLCLISTGCASDWSMYQARNDIAAGKVNEGINRMRHTVEANPDNVGYKMTLNAALERETSQLFVQGESQRQAGELDSALKTFRRILALHPEHIRTRRALELIERDRWHTGLMQEVEQAQRNGETDRAQRLLKLIVSENPSNQKAKLALNKLEMSKYQAEVNAQQLNPAMRKPITLEFRNAPLQSIIELISRQANLSFIFDRDVRGDQRATIFARNTPLEDALNVLLTTNQLDKKVLNDSTFIIYPKQPQKQKEYQDLIIRSFYLRGADPKQVLNQIKAITKTKDAFIDERLGLLTVRDTPEAIGVIEKLINTQDVVDPEVILDVEVLEVTTDWAYNLGLETPTSIGISVLGSSGKPGILNNNEITNLSRNMLQYSISDPALVLNLKNTTGGGNTLAKPRIRVRSREKAKVHIGDRVPVVTTTTNQQTGSVSDSVSYLDVGVMLEVEPQVYLGNEVGLKLGLEVSNIVKPITTKSGLLTYQIGSRKTNTVLRAQDGETQVLAGLIQNSDRENASHIPGLGNLPLLGRLFSNQNRENTKSEIVLLITPRIVRSLDTPAVSDMAIYSGTDGEVTNTPLRLRPSALVGSQSAGSEQTTAITTSIQPAGNDAATPATGNSAPPAKPQPTPTPTSPSSSDTHASGATGKLDLTVPAKISAGQNFTLTLSLIPGKPLASATTELIYNPEFIEFISASPGEAAQAATGFSLTPQTAPGRVSLNMVAPTGIAKGGQLVNMTFKAKTSTAIPLWLGIGQVRATDLQGNPVNLDSPAPRKMEFE